MLLCFTVKRIGSHLLHTDDTVQQQHIQGRQFYYIIVHM